MPMQSKNRSPTTKPTNIKKSHFLNAAYATTVNNYYWHSDDSRYRPRIHLLQRTIVSMTSTAVENARDCWPRRQDRRRKAPIVSKISRNAVSRNMAPRISMFVWVRLGCRAPAEWLSYVWSGVLVLQAAAVKPSPHSKT